jgi:hypothetical protein
MSDVTRILSAIEQATRTPPSSAPHPHSSVTWSLTRFRIGLVHRQQDGKRAAKTILVSSKTP